MRFADLLHQAFLLVKNFLTPGRPHRAHIQNAVLKPVSPHLVITALQLFLKYPIGLVNDFGSPGALTQLMLIKPFADDDSNLIHSLSLIVSRQLLPNYKPPTPL